MESHLKYSSNLSKQEGSNNIESHWRYGVNHLVTTTFVQKSYEIKKEKHQIYSWENASFDGLERSPRGIKFRLKIEGVFFLAHPKLVHGWQISPFYQVFGQFGV